MRTTITAVSAVFAVMSLATACGKHDDSTAASGAGAPATPSATTPAPAAGSAAPAIDDHACKLITQDEAAKLFANPVKSGEARMTGPVPSCRFKPEAGPGSVSLQYYERGEANIEPIRGMMLKDGVEISGVGTKAYRNPDGSLFMVLANGHLGVVIVMALGQKTKPTAANAEDFAKTLAGRL
jgi:hypothetical protein